MPELQVWGQPLEWGSLQDEVFVIDAAGHSRLGMPVSTRKCPHLFAVDLLLWKDPQGVTVRELIRYRDGLCTWVATDSLEDTVWGEQATCLPCFEDTLGLTAAQREVFETLLSEEIGPLGQYNDWTALVAKHAEMVRSLA